MLSFKSNMDEVITLIRGRLENIDIKEMTALQASTVIGEVRKRIHVDGRASDGSQIGSYSRGYLKVRSGLYPSAKVGQSGKSKGKVRSAGTFTKGRNKGSQRPKYNRGADPKVILSLTRQMESDMVIIPLENGTGIGYTNEANFKKSQWNERTYKKRIFYLTKEERELVYKTGQEYIDETLK